MAHTYQYGGPIMGGRVSTEVLTVVEHREPATRHVARGHQEVELIEVAEQLPGEEQATLRLGAGNDSGSGSG